MFDSKVSVNSVCIYLLILPLRISVQNFQEALVENQAVLWNEQEFMMQS
jgi:hypothetical protein